MKYYLIAGERSGDLHASNLMKSIKKKDPKAVFRGVGGDYMKEEGLDLFIHYKEMAVMGFLEVLMNIFKIWRFLRLCKNDIVNNQPDAVIFVDFAGFNLRIAKNLAPYPFKKFYYISPKIWAWNQKRAFKIRKYIDKAYVILPFEEAFYAKFDVLAQYVGNPVLDAINDFKHDEKFAVKHQIINTEGIVALLPGSRKQEIQHALPKLIQLAQAFPNKTFGLSIVKNIPESYYQIALAEQNIIPVVEDNYNLLLNAEAAIVTSGTATLETAIFEVPQVVIYEASRISYEITKRVIRVKYISLVNLILDRPLVKELIQFDFTVDNLVSELNSILEDPQRKSSIKKGYRDIRNLLGSKNASANTAEEIVSTLANHE